MSAFGKRDNNNEESQMWLGSFGKKGNDLRDLPYLLAKDAKPYFHFDIHQRDSTKDSNGRKTSKCQSHFLEHFFGIKKLL